MHPGHRAARLCECAPPRPDDQYPSLLPHVRPCFAVMTAPCLCGPWRRKREWLTVSDANRSWMAPSEKEDAALVRKENRSEDEAEASRSSGSSQRFVQQIPEELLDQILSCSVRGHADLRKIALTCKKWLGFASQETQWKRLCIRGWGHRSDIIQVPLDKDFAMAWREYYKRRLHTHLPSLEYMRYQQQMTVSIR